MAKIGELIINLKANTAVLARDFQKATGLSRSASQKISQALKVIAIGAAAAATALGAIGIASVKMAIDAVESENLFEVSMGRMAKAAREWSEEMSAALGLNAFEVRKMVGTFDVMTKSLGVGEEEAFEMSKALTKLAQDMASFFNLRPEEAFQKLQSGITGEIEPLKRLGVVVNETITNQTAYNRGIAEYGAKLTEAQKVQARYLAIMEQTSAAQGDLARTIDSPANALRVIRAQVEQLGIELGMDLLPAFRGVAIGGQKLVAWLREVREEVDSNSRDVGLLATAVRAIPVYITDWTIKLGLLNLELQEWKLRLESAAFAAMGVINALLPFKGDEARGFLQMAADAANEAAKTEELWNAQLSETTGRLRGLQKVLQATAPSIDQASDSHGGATAKANQHAKAIEALIEGLIEEEATFGRSREQIAMRTLALNDATQAQIDLVHGLFLSIGEMESLASITDIVAQANRDFDAAQKQVWDDAAANIEYAAAEVEGFGETVEKVNKASNEAARGAEQFAITIGRGFENAMLHGEGLRSVLAGIAVDLASMIFQMTVIGPLTKALSGINVFGSLFGGGLAGKQHGGPVSAGTPYLVGERGPEIFVPPAAGSIVPSGEIGGTEIHYHIDARGADAAVEHRVRRALALMEGRAVASALRAADERRLRA